MVGTKHPDTKYKHILITNWIVPTKLQLNALSIKLSATTESAPDISTKINTNIPLGQKHNITRLFIFAVSF